MILLAEDEEDYILLIQQAFSQANIRTPLHVVRDGQQAMMYLKGDGKYSNREEYPLPDLLLLDMKLPHFSGSDIIRWVRSEPGLEALRILVLTSSDRIRDVNESYRLGANSFLVKPYDFHDLVRLTSLIEDFWLKFSKRPETQRRPRNLANPHGQTGSTS